MLDLSVGVQTPRYVSPSTCLVRNVADSPGRRTACGHPFCLECILGWLSVQLSGFQEGNPGFTLTDHTIDALKDPLSNPRRFIEAVKVVKRRYPQFTCPTCRSKMTKRPFPFIVVGRELTDLCVGGRHGVGMTPPLQLDIGQVDRLFERYLLF